MNQFSTTCYFCTWLTKFYLTHLAKLTENKFTAVPYIVEGNVLYFSHRDLTGGLAFTFLRNLNILSWVKIIVLGVYCSHKSIWAQNSWICSKFMPKQKHLIFRIIYTFFFLPHLTGGVETRFNLNFINWLSFKLSSFIHM